MRKLALVIHNVRSAHNVGSMLRTADGLGVQGVYFTGYTPYPLSEDGLRLPHVARRAADQISKTALGAEYSVNWKHFDKLGDCLKELADSAYSIVALEQTDKAVSLDEFEPQGDIALVVGNEVQGLDKLALKQIGRHLKIPMRGQKESFNVAIAAAIVLYELNR